MARAVEAQHRQERVRELQGQVASAGRGMSNSQTALAGCGRFRGGRKRELTAEIEQHRRHMEDGQNQLQAVTTAPQGERPDMVAAQAPRLLEQAAATDARLAAAPERLKLALLETREQQAQAELELR